METTAEQAAEPTTEALDQFEEFLGTGDEPTGDEPAAEESQKETAADDADDEVQQPPVEGPSGVLKTLARQAGLKPSLIAIARDDKQLQAMIDAELDAREDGEPEPEPEAEPEPEEDYFAAQFEEGEYDDSDPIHRAHKSLVSRLNEFTKTQKEQQRKIEKNQALFAQWAHEQIAREQSQQAQVLYKPLDELLDDFGTDLFGSKSGGLSKTQQAVRAEIAEKYWALGARPDSPDEHKQHLADLAVRAYRKDLAELRDQKQQAVKRQAKNRTGGTPGKAPGQPRPKTHEESMETFEDFLNGRIELDLDDK